MPRPISIVSTLALLTSVTVGLAFARTTQAEPDKGSKDIRKRSEPEHSSTVTSGKLQSPKATATAAQEAKDKNAKQKVFVIQQETAQLGKMTVYAGESALRVKIGATGGNLVAKAPDWKIVFYNNQDLVYYETSFDKFQRQELPSMIAISDYFEGRKLNPQPVNYNGIRALKITAPTPEGSTVGMMMPSYSGVGNDATKSRAKSISIISTEMKPVPEKELQILKSIYRIPRFGGFPLGVFFLHNDNSSGVTLKTYGIKEANMSNSIFNYSLKGYKLEKTAETVMLSGMLESAFSLTP